MSFLVCQQQLEFKTIPASIQLVRYDPVCYSPKLFSQYLKNFSPEMVDQWVLKRQAQFLAGRIAAKNALSRLSSTSESPAIGKHREPRWATGIIGSISHTKNTSIATAQSETRIDKGLGLDIQAIFQQSEYTNILPIILSNQDQSIFKEMENCFPQYYLASLIFSAKESFFKAAFFQVNQYFDFKDVAIQSIDPIANLFVLVSQKNSIILPKLKLEIHYDFLELNERNMNVITYCVNKNVKKGGGG